MTIGSGSCTLGNSCYQLADANSPQSNLKGIAIPNAECVTGGSCDSCGRTTTFTGTFQATETCCAVDPAGEEDSACNYSPPVDPPSPCEGVTCSKRGKCQVLSHTEAKCKCENTFINSESGLDCVCPSNYEFNIDANRCFLSTDAPTKIPTKSPSIMITSASPEPSAAKEVEDEDECVDDVNAKFPLLKVEKQVGCIWLTKNKKKKSIRVERYCGLSYVDSICPKTCGVC